ncbi:MAG TPA: PDZ domain-containing protein [Spirochaetota bacterium]|nr:PDZ domain-containing protein [Spirochaetota bacterium]
MKKLLFVFIITLTVSSCMTMQQKAQQQWISTNNATTRYFLIPQAYKTSNEALSVIKLSQPNFVEWNGEQIVDLQIDQYGLLLKTRWESSNTEYKVRTVNTYDWNSGYNTTNVGGYETTTDSGYNSYTLSFKKLYSFSLILRNDLDRQYKWQIMFWYVDSDQPVLHFRAKDKGTAIDIINAIYTLAIKSGAKIKMPQTGMYASLLTFNQAKTLGMTDLKGVVITEISEDSPARKSGLCIDDVVTRINGNPVTTEQDFTNEIDKIGLKKIIMTVIRKKDFNEVNNTYNYEQIEIKIVL